MRTEDPVPRVSSKERNCTPLANLAPVKAETRNKPDSIYVLLAEASKKGAGARARSFLCDL